MSEDRQLAAHVLRQPALVDLAQLCNRKRRLALERNGFTASSSDNSRWQREQARALDHLFRDARLDGKHIAALVLAEPGGMCRQLAFVGEELDTHPRTICPARKRHLANRYQKPAVRDVVHRPGFSLADQASNE